MWPFSSKQRDKWEDVFFRNAALVMVLTFSLVVMVGCKSVPKPGSDEAGREIVEMSQKLRERAERWKRDRECQERKRDLGLVMRHLGDEIVCAGDAVRFR